VTQPEPDDVRRCRGRLPPLERVRVAFGFAGSSHVSSKSRTTDGVSTGVSQ
jgi:hypothetical protein